MNLKFLELRDRATRIPIFAFATEPYAGAIDRIYKKEHWLLRCAGFDCTHPMVIIGRIDCSSSLNSHCTYDPTMHGDRTFKVAHDFLEAHWEQIQSGDVIDVEFLLGEKDQPCKSDMP